MPIFVIANVMPGIEFENLRLLSLIRI